MAFATAITTSRTTATLVLWIGRGLEGLWLLLVFLVPLTFIDRDYAVSEAVISYLEVPKIALLRTLAGLMTTLWIIEWAIQGQLPDWSKFKGRWTVSRLSGGRTELSRWLRDRPTRWLVFAVWLFLGTTFLSTVLSGSFKTSVWGEIPGQDGYAAYTVASYLVIFGVIATHLKTRPQLWRLLGAIIAMGTLVAGYAVLQHYSYDFLDLTEQTGGGQKRVTSFMGNAIFAAAVMSMTIPISLGVAAASLREPKWLSRRFRTNAGTWALSLTVTGLWSLILAVQLLGITFTFSRGPWVGTLAAVVSFFGLGVIFLGWRLCGRAVLVLGLAAVMAVGFLQAMGSVSILIQGPWFGAVIAFAGVIGAGVILTNWRSLGWVGLLAGIIVALAAAVVLAPGWIKGDDASGEPPAGFSDTRNTIGQVSGRFASINTEVLDGFIGGRGTHWRVSWQLMRERPWFEFDNLSFRWLRPLIGYGPDLFRYTYLLESPPEGKEQYPLEPDHAHNYFIHQTVEQGYLGLLSSLGIFAAVFILGGYQLFRQRGSYSDAHKLIAMTPVR
ncbi:MAG: O-antigen ligase family protein [Chloroflexi bacterium]|nr:O-antigen ligase family protein [Chloroflexota bacterium]